MESVKKIISPNYTEKQSNSLSAMFSDYAIPYHVAFWTLYVSLAYLSIESNDIGRLGNAHAFFNLLFGLTIFYSLAEYWFPKLAFNPQRTKTALVALFSFFTLLIIKIATTRYVSDITYQLPRSIILEITRAFLFSLLALGFWFIKLAIKYQKKSIEDNKQIRNLNVDKSMTQLSPHFLFNSLNTLLPEIYTYSKTHANLITSLSNIVRYAFLSDNPLATVDEEITVLEKFLKLQRKRFKKDLYLIYSKSKGIKKIGATLPMPKMILTTLIENIFKHGCYNDPEYPVSIRIIIDKKNRPECKYQFIFELTNKIGTYSSKKSFGLGIKNSEEILDHYLPGRYTIHTLEKDGIFHLNLKINYEPERFNGSHN